MFCLKWSKWSKSEAYSKIMQKEFGLWNCPFMVHLYDEDFLKSFCCFSITSMEFFKKPLYWKVGQQREYKLTNPSVHMFILGCSYWYTLFPKQPRIKTRSVWVPNAKNTKHYDTKCKILTPKKIASEEWPHGIEIISNGCKGPQSLRMRKVGFPLDALEFENR